MVSVDVCIDKLISIIYHCSLTLLMARLHGSHVAVEKINNKINSSAGAAYAWLEMLKKKLPRCAILTRGSAGAVHFELIVARHVAPTELWSSLIQ
jgi:hypothetical protein